MNANESEEVAQAEAYRRRNDILKPCKAVEVVEAERDRMVIEALARMAASPRLTGYQCRTGDCVIAVERDENGVISVYDYKPLRSGFVQPWDHRD